MKSTAIARLNQEMKVPDIEQGSKSDVDLDGILDQAPSIIYKMYRPAFDSLDKQSWQYRED